MIRALVLFILYCQTADCKNILIGSSNISIEHRIPITVHYYDERTDTVEGTFNVSTNSLVTFDIIAHGIMLELKPWKIKRRVNFVKWFNHHRSRKQIRQLRWINWTRKQMIQLHWYSLAENNVQPNDELFMIKLCGHQHDTVFWKHSEF